MPKGTVVIDILIAVCLSWVAIGVSSGEASAGTVRESPNTLQVTHPDDIYWEKGPDLMGVSSTVRSSVVCNGQLVVAGRFSVAGDKIVQNIAAWNGVEWSPLGSGLSHTAPIDVFALAVYDNKLVAAGTFTTAGGTPAKNIAVWDGSSWSPLGTGLSSRVYSLTVYDNKLIAGGWFTDAGGVAANRIAAWDGSTWAPLRQGFNGTVFTLAVYGNQLIAGGDFSMADTVAASNIAVWDGSYWSAFGSGADDKVLGLYADNNLLIAGGEFHTMDGIPVGGIASWDGSSWSSLVNGTNGKVLALAPFENTIIATGDFSTAGGVPVNNIASWDGSTWSALGTGFGRSNVLTMSNYNGQLAAAGSFLRAGDSVAANIAVWDGATWSPICEGWSGVSITSHAIFEGKLIVAGRFEVIDDFVANNVAAFDGSDWSPMGSGFDDEVADLVVYDNQLFAAGGWGVSAWDGNTWSLESLGPSGVKVLCVYDGKLHAGYFHGYSSLIEVREGTYWTQLPGYFGQVLVTDSQRLNDMVVFNDRLIVAGHFVQHPSMSQSIAAWDGAEWTGVGGLGTFEIQALGVYNNMLYAGGPFLSGFLRVWDGSAWSSIPGMDPEYGVEAFSVFDGRLIVGGWLQPGTPVACNNIAAWDGISWSPLGSGLDGPPSALSVYNDKLVVTGGFFTAGNNVSAYFTRWVKPVTTAVTILDFKARPSADGIVVSWSLHADENVEGFRIYRRRVGEATEFVINDHLISPTEGTFTDRDARPGERYLYTLVVAGSLSGDVRSETVEAEMPTIALKLDQNSPNPFNPMTAIRYTIPSDSHVLITVHSPTGQLVRTLVDEMQTAGRREEIWDGTNDTGNPVASGVYICRLRAGKATQSIKLNLLK